MSNKTVQIEEISNFLDITSDLCPMTFVKARLFLEKQHIGHLVQIKLAAGEPLDNLPEALRLDGHEVISVLADDGRQVQVPASHHCNYVMLLRVGELSPA
jgi:TusA-related sulfurtransferase